LPPIRNTRGFAEFADADRTFFMGIVPYIFTTHDSITLETIASSQVGLILSQA
jgi:hypothetical protein